MEKRGDRTQRKFPLEAEGHISKDQQQREQHRKPALLAQILTHLGPDELDPTQRYIRVGGTEHVHHRFAKRCTVELLVRAQANERVARSAEVLHLRILEAGATQRITYGAEIGGFGVTDLDQRATGEIDAEIEAAHAQRQQRKDNQG